MYLLPDFGNATFLVIFFLSYNFFSSNLQSWMVIPRAHHHVWWFTLKVGRTRTRRRTHHMTCLLHHMIHYNTAINRTGLRYAKRSLMSGVVVITRPSFFWYDTDFLGFFFFWKFLDFFFFWKVGVILKEGRARPRAPVLLLVWQRLRTLETFLHNTAQFLRQLYACSCDSSCYNVTIWSGSSKIVP